MYSDQAQSKGLVRDATSIALSQDARRGMLLVRLAVVNKSMEVRRFVMGYAQLEGTDTFDLQKTLLTMLRRFCTTNMPAPSYGKVRQQRSRVMEPEVDESLYNHLCSHVHG